MSNLNQLLLKRLKAKHAKLSKRFLKGVEAGHFQTLNRRKRHNVVERLKKIERQIKSASQRSGFGFNLNLRHWAVALAMGAVVTVASGQQKKPENKTFKSRLNKLHNMKQGNAQRSENQTITLTEVAQLGNAYPENLLTGDFDGDGDNDILFVSYLGGVFLLTNNGSFNFSAGPNITDDLLYGSTLGDFDGDGDLDVIYKIFPTEETYAFINDGSGSFTKQAVTLPNTCFSSRTGDIDGDGDDDFLVDNNYCDLDYANGPYDSFGFKLLTNNNLNFAESAEFIAGVDGQTRFIGFADIDGDGDLDIPVIHRTLASNSGAPYYNYIPGVTSFKAFLNDGSGNFADAGFDIDPILTTNFPRNLLGDIDGDGSIDVLWTDGGSSVAILNDGSGNFTPQSQVPFNLNIDQQDDTLIDLNGDTFADIVNEGFSNDSTILFSGDGVGGFTQETKISGESVLSDLDGDGDPDFVTVNGNVEINELQPGFTLANRNEELIVISQTYDVDVVDIDDDGDNDIIHAGEQNTSRVWLNDGTGTNFTIGQRLDSAALAHVLADLDGDGDQDMIRANEFDSYQFPNKPGIDINSNESGVITFQNSLSTSEVDDIDVADFDGDGDLDICMLRSNYPSAYLKIFSNEGSFAFSQIDSLGFSSSDGVNQFDIGDVDGDSDIDVVISYGNQGFIVASNDGTGVFTAGEIFVPQGSTFGIEDVDLADFDGDGDLDVFASNGDEYATASYIFINDGTGNFTDNGQDLTIGYIYRSAIVDLDGDGDVDIITGGYLSNPQIWTNDGSANFTQDSAVPILADEYAQPAFGDLDGDGDIDLAFGGFYNPNLVFLVEAGESNPLQADSSALVAFYNATNGDNWTNNEGWLQDGVALADWFGVTVNTEDVTELILPDNNIDGPIPPEFVDLTGLVTVDLSNNLINAIEGDFTVNSSITSFDLSGNLLDFADFEALNNISELDIGEQSTNDMAIDDRLPAGTSTSFTFIVEGANNEYQWFLNGDALPAETNSTIDIASLTRENMGEYICEATNTVITGVTITSEVKRVIATAEIGGSLKVSETDPATAGEVKLLEITSTGGFDTTAIVSVATDGAYEFTDVTLSDYLLVGITDTIAHPDALPTYFTQTPFWAEADTLFLNGNESIDLVSVFSTNPTGGIGRFSGYLEEELPDGGRTEVRGRVRGAGVSMRRGKRLGRGEGSGELVYYVYTDENGEFLIPDVEPGEYNLDIQYPGYPMDENSFLDITIGEDPKSSQVAVEALVDNDVITVSQLVILGTNEIENGLLLYPNPTSDVLNIRDAENRVGLQLEVFNSLGASIKKVELSEIGISVRELVTGQYIIKVTDASGKVLLTRRVQVEQR